MSSFPDLDPADPLLARARAGDHGAFEALYRLYATPIHNLLRRMVGRAAAAEDLTQDCFVQLLRQLPAYAATGSFAGWVRSIAVRAALMHLRSPWQRRLAGEPPELPASEPAEAGGNAALERALDELPAVTRSVLWLHDVEGHTHAEIARLFGRTASFSKSQLARAHQQLRERLDSTTRDLPCTSVPLI